MSPASTQTSRIVITGGPCSGKTTLVRALAARGFPTIPEAAISVIEEKTRELGLEGQAAWRAANREAFQECIIEKQLQLESRELPEGPVFLDRGRLDGVAYCRVHGSAVPASLARACEELPYELIFVLDTLSTFDARRGTGRTSDRRRSLAIRRALIAVYREAGYEPIPVPEMPIGQRVEFLLSRLRETTAVCMG